MKIYSNDALTSLEGLESVISVGGYVHIELNNSLTNLSGLESVASIFGYLNIKTNYALTSLSGLDNLGNIGGYLKIYSNDALTSLTGLDNINAASVDNLKILYNDSLSICNVQSVCDYLASPNAVIEIHDNANGCNSIEEVDSLCNITDVREFTTINEILIFPNPAKNEISISVKDGVIIKEINIYNQIGQRLIHKKGKTNTVDVSMLPCGMYILEVEIDNGKLRSKLMIK